MYIKHYYADTCRCRLEYEAKNMPLPVSFKIETLSVKYPIHIIQNNKLTFHL